MKHPTTYADAGVAIERGQTLVERIRPWAKRSHRSEVLQGIGGFCALMELPLERYQNPVLATATDGVGTKLCLGIAHQRYEGLGQDLVAMCVNDLVVSGAEPLCFLDYYATGRLDPDVAETIIAGISQACIEANCSLIGGETAEMPGLYREGDFDLAGFAVGVVERTAILSGAHAQEGDVVLGLASSGPHANGFSLIRRLLEQTGVNPAQHLMQDGRTFLDHLMTPTLLYVDALLRLHRADCLVSAAHITGGGLNENLPRCLPKQVSASLRSDAWIVPEWALWCQEHSGLSWSQMLGVFNCGVGMVLCVPQARVAEATQLLQHTGHTVFVLGDLVKRRREEDPAVLWDQP